MSHRLHRLRPLLLLPAIALAWWALQAPSSDSESMRPFALPPTPDLQPRIAPGQTTAAAEVSIALQAEPAAISELQMRAKADEGARLFAARRLAEAAALLVPAAEYGYPQAQYQVGWMHYLGFGLPRDLEAAAQWFERAAQQGNVDGMNALGTALREGKGTVQDYSQALHWYENAAEQGHPDGEVNLGFMLEMGYGTKQDLPAAARNYRLAAEQNHATAQFYLGSLYEEGKGVAADPDAARGWYRRAAAQGNEYARLALQRLEGSAPPSANNSAAQWPGER